MNTIELERQYKALANRRRLAILQLLKKRREVNVSDISEAIKLSFTSTSKHLTMLERGGFVENEQKSLSVFYRLASAPSPILKHLLAIF